MVMITLFEFQGLEGVREEVGPAELRAENPSAMRYPGKTR